MAFVIAIDGPAGAGKSTVARQVAGKLNYNYIDTGAMYRAVALRASQNHIAVDCESELAVLARQLTIRFTPLTSDGRQKVFVDGDDVTKLIREPEITSLTSQISVYPSVRRVIVAQQQRFGSAETDGIVLEGRDIGTVVFPNANLKIFLTASPVERARRRREELSARGLVVEANQVLHEIEERDKRDSTRVESPLLKAIDAIEILTDSLSISEVVDLILQYKEERQ